MNMLCVFQSPWTSHLGLSYPSSFHPFTSSHTASRSFPRTFSSRFYLRGTFLSFWSFSFFILLDINNREKQIMSRWTTTIIPRTSRTHSPITHSKLSPINLVSIFRCSSSQSNTVYVRHIGPSVLTFRFSLHRHPHICIPFRSRFICCS